MVYNSHYPEILPGKIINQVLSVLNNIYLFIPILLCILKADLFSQANNDLKALSIDDAVSIALENNLMLKNAAIRAGKENDRIHKIPPLEPLEINYRIGQLYSEENDTYLEFNQHFGSILTHFKHIKQVDARHAVAASQYDLLKSEVIAQVKSAYLFWVYTIAVSDACKEEDNLYSQFEAVADMRYQKGDISLLERTTYQAKVSEIHNNYLNSIDNIRIAENKMRELLQDTGKYLPDKSELKLYQIEKTNDTSSFSGNRMLELYYNKYLLARTDQSLANAGYFPHIHAGIFTQDITGLNRLYGGQIGLSVPLWFSGIRADQTTARIESEISLNEYEYQKNKIICEIDNLILELNKFFREIRYFEADALPLSEMLINTASKQFDAEEIDYSEFLTHVSMAYKIKRDYYKAIMSYNQTALQLEIYAD